MNKKTLFILSSTTLAIIVVISYLFLTGYWTDKSISTRKLNALNIPASPEQVKLATEKGELKVLKYLYHFGVDFNSPATLNEKGERPLIVAAKGKQWRTFQDLIKYGQSPHKENGDPSAPLSYLLEEGKTDLVKSLLKNGVDANPILTTGEPALTSYIRAGNIKLVELLLNYAADPDTRATDGSNGLFISLKTKNPKLRELLFKYKANPNTLSPAGTPLLTYFCRDFSALDYTTDEAQSTISSLINHGAEQAIDDTGWRPLQWLIHQGRMDLAALIMEKEPNVKGTLWIALNNRDYHTAGQLLNLHADPNETTPYGVTPLMLSLRENRIDFMNLLLDHKADPEKHGEEGQAALITAIAMGNTQAALQLLHHPTNPANHSAPMAHPVKENFRALFGKKGYFDWYCRNKSGLTPLMGAVMLKNLIVAEALIKSGAKRNQGTSGRHKVYPIQMAANNNDVKMQQLVLGVPHNDDEQERQFVIDLSEQKVRYFREGKLIKTSRCSTGRSGYRTKPGHYVISDRTKHKVSNIYKGAKMPYFQRFSCGAIGFHQGNTGSRYASHGCIRLPMSTAKYFWTEAKVGDRVEIKN